MVEPESPPTVSPEGDIRMTFWEHLSELRSRVIKCAIGLLVCTSACWSFRVKILGEILRPYERAWVEHGLLGRPELQTLSPADAFVGYLQLSLGTGAICASPILFYQLWAFISPGLYSKEKRLIVPFVFFSTLLFLSGVAFAYFVAFPFTFGYFFSLLGPVGDQGTVLTQRPTLEFYLDFATRMILAFGFVFELPLFISFLVIARLVTPMQLLRFGRWAVILAFLIGAVVTPGPEISSQLAVSGALIALYFLSIVISFVIVPRKREESRGMSAFPPVDEQVELVGRGVVDVHTVPELRERMAEAIVSGVPLRVKAGFDPTRPDLHLGHAVLLQKLRQFQVLGHKVILLVGDFTAMVGDPTGQNDLRPRLTRQEVRAAAATYTEQAFRILDRDATELRYNSEWLDELSAAEMVELMAKTTVARMLERNDFGARFSEHRPIFQHEFLYPLLQAYDSVALKCDMELGGTDQLFNLLMGRDLMPKYGLRGQMVLTVPILEGTDAKMGPDGQVVGKKMSKSADNYVGLLEPPAAMYRKVMQIDDDVIFRYFDLLSPRSNAEVAELRERRRAGDDPRGFKAMFAEEIIERMHGAGAASEAKAEFDKVYAADALPEHIDSFEVPTEGSTLWLAKALSSAGLVKSTGEGRRLCEQGGVEVDRARVTDPQTQLEKGQTYLLRVGSKNRRFAYVKVV